MGGRPAGQGGGLRPRAPGGLLSCPGPRVIERERAGLPDQPRKPTPLEEELARDPKAVLAEVLERDGTEYSATEVRQRNLADADHLARLHVIWQGEVREPRNARHRGRAARPAAGLPQDAALKGTSTWLYRGLAGSPRRPASTAATCWPGPSMPDRWLTPGTWRPCSTRGCDRRLKGLVPQPPRPWAEQVPEDAMRNAAATWLGWPGRWTTGRVGWVSIPPRARPGWAERALGPVPDDPAGRQAWQEPDRQGGQLPGDVCLFQSERCDRPGAVNSPEARQHWHAAFAALGPVDGPGPPGPVGRPVADAPWPVRARDGMGSAVGRRPAAAGAAGAADAEREAVLFAVPGPRPPASGMSYGQAQLHDTLASSYRALAGRYQDLEQKFAQSMEARKAWEETTRQQRHDALAAHDEYLRRHPHSDLEPLRSAEPAGD